MSCKKTTMLTEEEKRLNEALAETIRQYWKRRGYEVCVDVKEQKFQDSFRACRHEIRSDMMNGYPMGYKKEDMPHAKF